MAINNHLNLSTLVNSAVGQNIFQIKSKVGSEPLYFLQELYTSPPKLNIVWRDFEAMGSSSSNSAEFTLPKTAVKPNVNWLNRRLSKNSLNQFTGKIKNALKTVPVYVVVSGRNELVVATSKSIRSPNYTLLRQPKRQKFGFIFFDKREADLYLNVITDRVNSSLYTERASGLSQIGLSIHCIGLDYAYSLFRNSADIDFRFVPNLSQVNYLLENINQLDNSGFRFGDAHKRIKSGQYQSIPLTGVTSNLGELPSTILASEFTQPIRKLEGSILPSFDNLNAKSFRGVPVYIVQLNGISSQVSQEILEKVNSLCSEDTTFARTSSEMAEKVSPSILSYYNDFHDPKFSGSRVNSLISKDQTTITDSEKGSNYSNYVFFDKLQAEQYAASFNSSRITSVSILNLEDFLEMWEDSIVLKQNSMHSNFSFNPEQPTYFIPSKESVKVLKDYAEQPKKSFSKLVGSWARGKLIKLRWLQHDYLGLFLRGYKI